jgi:hypothetical protein
MAKKIPAKLDRDTLPDVQGVRRTQVFNTKHIGYPDAEGRPAQGSEEVTRHLRPNVRQLVLHPPQIKAVKK